MCRKCGFIHLSNTPFAGMCPEHSIPWMYATTNFNLQYLLDDISGYSSNNHFHPNRTLWMATQWIQTETFENVYKNSSKCDVTFSTATALLMLDTSFNFTFPAHPVEQRKYRFCKNEPAVHILSIDTSVELRFSGTWGKHILAPNFVKWSCKSDFSSKNPQICITDIFPSGGPLNNEKPLHNGINFPS